MPTTLIKLTLAFFLMVSMLGLGFTGQSASADEKQAVATVAKSESTKDGTFLSHNDVYSIMIASILGSLGVLGLLLGIDRVIIAILPRSKDKAGRPTYYSAQYVTKVLPIVIEGITVILVVLAVMLLGLLGIVNSEGIIGILGAIVGYVLGKSSGKQMKAGESTSESINGSTDLNA